MPEGDTIHATAATLRKALGGRRVTRFETQVERVAAVASHASVTGRVVQDVSARGKHLLMRLHGDGTDLILHTHMRMDGEWHVYKPGERWWRSPSRARVVVHTDDYVAPCFDAPVVELLTAREVERHPVLAALGPDATSDGFDVAAARERLRQRRDKEIADALLDQRVVAGIGNVYKSEILFLRRISPFAKVSELDDTTLDALLLEAHDLLQRNRGGGGRRTRFGLDGRERLWVYERSGERCLVCGATIAMRRQGSDVRLTYYCPRCQAVAT